MKVWKAPCAKVTTSIFGLAIAVALCSSLSFAADFPSHLNDRVKNSSNPDEAIKRLSSLRVISADSISVWHANHSNSVDFVATKVEDLVSIPLSIEQVMIVDNAAYFLTHNKEKLPIYCLLQKNLLPDLSEVHALTCIDQDLKTRLIAFEGYDGVANRVENNLDANDLPDSGGFVRMTYENTFKIFSEGIYESSYAQMKDFFVDSGLIKQQEYLLPVGVVGSKSEIFLFQITDKFGAEHSCAFIAQKDSNYLGCIDSVGGDYSLLLANGSPGSLLIVNKLTR